MISLTKPAKGTRLRAKSKARGKAKADLSALYGQVYARDGYRCRACGKHVTRNAVDELERAHPHHIVFRSRAGKADKHTTANVCTLCAVCHADVHDHTLTIRGNADQQLTMKRL